MAQINAYSQPFAPADSQPWVKKGQIFIGKKTTVYTRPLQFKPELLEGQRYVAQGLSPSSSTPTQLTQKTHVQRGGWRGKNLQQAPFFFLDSQEDERQPSLKIKHVIMKRQIENILFRMNLLFFCFIIFEQQNLGLIH